MTKWKIAYVFSIVLFFACKKNATVESQFVSLSGTTMGTFYEIKANSKWTPDQIQLGIDSLLEVINLSASTYLPNSIISQFNRSDSSLCLEDNILAVQYMEDLFNRSDELYEMTDGYFDPSAFPLIKYWGFGPQRLQKLDAVDQDSILILRELVNWNKISVKRKDNQICFSKQNSAMTIDMNAIAKGYGVDILGGYLSALKSNDYYVNIGGEVRTHGNNHKGELWKLGVNVPDEKDSYKKIVTAIGVADNAVASSGNYENFYQTKTGKRVHTINPKSGFAEPTDLLQATIVAEDCATADALATACMAMGLERAKVMLKKNNKYPALLLYKDQDNLKAFWTNGMQSLLVDEPTELN